MLETIRMLSQTKKLFRRRIVAVREEQQREHTCKGQGGRGLDLARCRQNPRRFILLRLRLAIDNHGRIIYLYHDITQYPVRETNRRY